VSLEEALADLDEAVTAFVSSETGDAAGVLAAVFKLNNEIGRRLRPSGDPSLKMLQLKVNEVAVAAKRGDKANLATAMGRVRVEFHGARTEG